jgi:hypothetical protein
MKKADFIIGIHDVSEGVVFIDQRQVSRSFVGWVALYRGV